MLTTTLRPKTCHCGKEFMPARMGQRVCGPVCAGWVAKKERKQKEQARRDAVEHIPKLLAQARDAFNTWVRLRDALLPCVSCDAPPPDLSGLHAGRDAGHFRSVGSASHLRFHPDNVHAQCVHCNQHLAGNVVAYRVRLVERIGLARVVALEDDCGKGHKWRREEIVAIRDTYRARAKELRKGLA